MNARVWMDAARPKTLGASIAPVVLGTALASRDGHHDALVALLIVVAALAIQIGTNFCNDYCDFKRGADRNRVGPIRATQAGLVSPEAMKMAAILSFALALFVGIFLVWRGGTPILAIGLISIACGALYTAGPYPLAYVGLGDLFVLIFFGPVAVAGTYYLQALTWSSDAWMLGLMPGFLSVGILVVNNLRDRESDCIAHKRTLVVLFGEKFGRLEYACCLAASALVVISFQQIVGLVGSLCVMSLLVGAGFVLTLGVLHSEGRELHRFLPATNMLLIITSLLTAIFLVCPL